MIKSGKQLLLLKNMLEKVSSVDGLIVDIGTPQRFHKELRPFESMFLESKYKAYGYNPKLNYGQYNCDGHQDIENLKFENESVGAVICLDVLEHVGNPFRAAKEIVRVMRAGGLLLLSVPFQNGYHGKDGRTHSHENYPDYWRFTHTGLKYLFQDLRSVDLYAVDGPIEFKLRQLHLGKYIDTLIGRIIIDFFDTPTLGRATSRHILFGEK